MARNDPPLAVFFTCCLSHFAFVPSLVQQYRRRWHFEFCVGIAAIMCSFMYHTCQAFNTVLFLSELQWHRLDNIGALSSFAILFVYLANIKDPQIEAYLKYMLILMSVIIQEKDPWNEIYTFVPVLVMSLIPFVSHGLVYRKMPQFEAKNFVMGFGLLAAALPFFVAGLDDGNDPYRLYHGMWHVVGSFSSLFLWRIVRNPAAVVLQGYTPYEKMNLSGTLFDSRV
jgi:hypothetical protein